MTKHLIAGMLAATLGLAAAACDRLGPQQKKTPTGSTGAAETLYEPDMSKPDGPVLQILRAAQDNDEALFKASFAPTANTTGYSDDLFKKMRRKVLVGRITPVPDATQTVGDSEAVVKVRDGKGHEVPIHVQKFDDKWLITAIDIRPKAQEKVRVASGQGK